MTSEPALCPECEIELTPRVPQHAIQWCLCCSSRFKLGQQIHCGSHNDYGTYLCERSRPEREAFAAPVQPRNTEGGEQDG